MTRSAGNSGYSVVKKELIGSIIGHALVVLFLFAISARGRSLPPPSDLGDIMTVTPVDALPAGLLPTPKAEVPSPADDANVDEAVAIPEKEPEAVPVEPKQLAEKPKPKPKETQKKPAETKPREPPAKQGSYESTVQAGGQGQTGGSLLGLPGGTPGARAATYPDRVANKAFYMWHNPAKLQEQVTCSVTFRIDRDGKASQIALNRSSGFPAYDNSAVRAVYEAAPYPPFPRSMDEQYIMMTINFVYTP